jgi:hypothetical protein
MPAAVFGNKRLPEVDLGGTPSLDPPTANGHEMRLCWSQILSGGSQPGISLSEETHQAIIGPPAILFQARVRHASLLTV